MQPGEARLGRSDAAPAAWELPRRARGPRQAPTPAQVPPRNRSRALPQTRSPAPLQVPSRIQTIPPPLGSLPLLRAVLLRAAARRPPERLGAVQARRPSPPRLSPQRDRPAWRTVRKSPGASSHPQARRRPNRLRRLGRNHGPQLPHRPGQDDRRSLQRRREPFAKPRRRPPAQRGNWKPLCRRRPLPRGRRLERQRRRGDPSARTWSNPPSRASGPARESPIRPTIAPRGRR